MESSSFNENITTFILRSGWLKNITAVSHLASGEYNSNYLVETETGRYVFRINHGSQLFISNQIEYEFNVLKSLENSGVTPVPYYYDLSPAGFDGGVLLMEYIEGRPLDYKLHSARAADIFARIHSQRCGETLIRQLTPVEDICTESMKLILMHDFNEYSDVRRLLLEYRERMLKLAEKSGDFFRTEAPCTVNTEVNSGNFLISEKRCALVDWEKAVVSCRYQDLGHFLVSTTTLWKTDYRFTAQEKENFLRVYREQISKAESLDEIIFKTGILEQVILLRALSWCYMAYHQYSIKIKGLTHNDTFTRIKYYLDNAECFLKSEN